MGNVSIGSQKYARPNVTKVKYPYRELLGSSAAARTRGKTAGRGTRSGLSMPGNGTLLDVVDHRLEGLFRGVLDGIEHGAPRGQVESAVGAGAATVLRDEQGANC